ncbi:hypothetical protein OROGR_031564 [Orobanche gracilis]
MQQFPSEARSSVLKDEIEEVEKELESQNVIYSMLEKPRNCQLLLDDPVHIPPSQ